MARMKEEAGEGQGRSREPELPMVMSSGDYR